MLNYLMLSMIAKEEVNQQTVNSAFITDPITWGKEDLPVMIPFTSNGALTSSVAEGTWRASQPSNRK